MKKLPFTKMHGTWNDFIIIRNTDLLTLNIKLTPDLISKICDRNFWIWSDGLLIVTKWETTEFKYIMYNPDGTQAEMCGNGIRCYMKYLVDNNLTSKKEIDVETWAWILHLSIDEDIITVDMWNPWRIKELIFESQKLWDRFFIKSEWSEFAFTPVSMGNPHAVIFLKRDKVRDFDIEKYGKNIERNTEIFPNKVNVEFINILTPSEIDMRVWERGAWETLACGTGACASVAAWILRWHLETNTFIKVNLIGWVLEVKWTGNKQNSVIMRGPAETVFSWEYLIK